MKTRPPRISRVVEAMKRDNLDAILIMSPAQTCYLSGCNLLTQTEIPDRHAYVILTSAGEASYLVCNIEELAARRHSWIENINIYVEFQEVPARAVLKLLRQHGLANARIGVEVRRMPHESMQIIADSLPQASFVPWDEGLAHVVMIKDDDEVEELQKAGELTLAAIVDGLTGAPVGSSELQVANRIITRIMSAGLVSAFNVFAAGPNLMEAHSEATDRIMEPGEIVRLDMGGRLPSNYISDMARTAVVGQPTSEQARTYQTLYDIQQQVIEASIPGKPVSSLYEICAEGYERAGIPFHMPHIGHGMGIGLHEEPMIHPGNKTPIEPGMVLNIEPHLSLEDRHESYHIEDLILVQQGAPRLLTIPTPELIVIPC